MAPSLECPAKWLRSAAVKSSNLVNCKNLSDLASFPAWLVGSKEIRDLMTASLASSEMASRRVHSSWILRTKSCTDSEPSPVNAGKGTFSEMRVTLVLEAPARFSGSLGVGGMASV